MTRRGRRRRTERLPEEQLQHVAGVRVTWPGSTCGRCFEELVLDERAVPHGNGWIHVGCASGSDDR